ncbi:phosphoribosylglycinamide formyltransferase [Aquipluma nitroreducens]|uniref:Phosphoribosylglycinamide formyltransferase n=1 Tax=Aquipluma nitroreducens TaxID=2010828 RepID=A0A5K7S738_9BACT|nr:phosphoribosylglycinamide formyltransferase [Aquipluma nitroreducens]BBE17378.1 phosphoribosylglycinamide formyltransferase [Aquipluma nitroreducens]
MKRIAIFASGSGTNAQKIIEYFSTSKEIVVDSLWSNNENAYALIRAEKLGIETFTFESDEFYRSNEILDRLYDHRIDMIVLAGFLWLVPRNLTELFTVINIHPALLPKYGGKGMFGVNVHKAVLASKDKESGITIHQVNQDYDKGKIIFQATCPILPKDTPETLAARIHELEYQHYPRVIEEVLLSEEDDD